MKEPGGKEKSERKIWEFYAYTDNDIENWEGKKSGIGMGISYGLIEINTNFRCWRESYLEKYDSETLITGENGD